MEAGFMAQWVKEVKAAKPEKDALVALLCAYGATEADPEESPDVGSLHYALAFQWEGVEVTVFFNMMDWQALSSDVVITNMTTLPEGERKKGFGSRAVCLILRWARDNRLREVRATQVHMDNESFWLKNGFVKDSQPNPCNDFVFRLE